MRVDDGPVWVQPVAFGKREWEYQELTLTGEAAQIDQQARDEERARLRELWTQVTPDPLWNSPFGIPAESFLEVSANYGARRSYNGGPYLTYHEGVDFSAYGGTPVLAPAGGTVVLAVNYPLVVFTKPICFIHLHHLRAFSLAMGCVTMLAPRQNTCSGIMSHFRFNAHPIRGTLMPCQNHMF